MHHICRIGLAIAMIGVFHSSKLADKFDFCSDPESARRYAKSWLRENPCNAQQSLEARAQHLLRSAVA
jgi:hypothetical protein